MLLARRGYRVLLVDRARFPSDTVSSHLVFQTGLARLKAWGLLSRLLETGPPATTEFGFDFGGGVIKGRPREVDGVDFIVGPRRTILDAMLLDEAAKAGAEVRQGFSVRDLVVEEGRVVGVRGDNGSEGAALVVGADGRNSLVARRAGAALLRDEGARTISYYSYWADLPTSGWEFYGRTGWGIGIGPTHDGLTIANMGTTREQLPRFRQDVETTFMEVLRDAPELHERVQAAGRVEPFRGLAEIPNFVRQSHGPGWVLAGDAGYYRDPITAQGISDAFRDVDLLVEAIDRGLGGGDIDDELRGYQAERDRQLAPMLEWTLMSTAFMPQFPVAIERMQAIAASPELSQRFLDLNPGLARSDEVFAAAGG